MGAFGARILAVDLASAALDRNTSAELTFDVLSKTFFRLVPCRVNAPLTIAAAA